MLGADLLAVSGDGPVDARRRGVALRLVAAGLTPELLEAVLPGWSRYLQPSGAPGTEAVA